MKLVSQILAVTKIIHAKYVHYSIFWYKINAKNVKVDQIVYPALQILLILACYVTEVITCLKIIHVKVVFKVAKYVLIMILAKFVR